MDLFSKKNIRKTAFRSKVLDVFRSNENAITIQDIENGIGLHDRITLYRTIKTFLDKGVIHEIVMTGDIKKLALCNDCGIENDHKHVHNHVHFHCEKCDEVICVDNKMPSLNLKGFQVESFEIQARGTCVNCV